MKALFLLPISLLVASPAAAASVVIASPGTSIFLPSANTARSFSAPVATPTTIDFEGYSDPTDYYSLSTSGATFTGNGATDLFEISAYGESSWGTSGPKILCPHTAALYCGGGFTVTFADAVTGLQFYFTGDQTSDALTVQAFLGATSLGTISVNGDGKMSTAQLVNLSSFGQITSIQVTPPPREGLGYDDFSFIKAVPEPSTWAMMLLGFGGIGLALRRRKKSLALAGC